MGEKTDWRAVPIYKETGQYAREHGELETFRQSNRANEFCARGIDQMIRENFDGVRLDPKCIQPVIDTYGMERTLFVLANTVQQKDYDGRFSQANKLWAWTISVPPSLNGLNEDYRWHWVAESHPAVLDGFVNLARKAAAEQEKSSILGQLDKPIQRKTTDHKQSKSKEESR